MLTRTPICLVGERDKGLLAQGPHSGVIVVLNSDAPPPNKHKVACLILLPEGSSTALRNFDHEYLRLVFASAGKLSESELDSLGNSGIPVFDLPSVRSCADLVNHATIILQKLIDKPFDCIHGAFNETEVSTIFASGHPT